MGLDLGHTRADLIRSAMEGVAFGLRVALDELRRLTHVSDEMTAVGGISRSRLWRQMLADAFGIPVITTHSVEGGAFGAAMIAACGVGVFDGVADASETLIRETGRTDPDDANHRAYRETYALYTELYPALKRSFTTLAALSA